MSEQISDENVKYISHKCLEWLDDAEYLNKKGENFAMKFLKGD